MSRFTALFLSGVFLFLPLIGTAAVKTVGPVSCAYSDLASAVTAASAGDEIRIHKDYAEPTNVRIEKSLTIIGGLPHCFAATPETATSISHLSSANPAPRQVLDVRGAGVEVTLYHLWLSGAPNAGGLNVQDGAVVRAGGVEISGNTALLGGGVWVHGAESELQAIAPPFSSNLSALHVHGNQAPQGGGVYLGSGTQLRTMALAKTVRISGNTALDLGGTTGRGGGLYLQAGAHAAYLGVVSGNSAVLGGGLYVEGRPGGIPVPSHHDVSVDWLQNNTAEKGGAAYVAVSDEVSVYLSTLLQNLAEDEGGGLWFGSRGTASLDYVEDNQSSGTGGGIQQIAGEIRIRQSLNYNSANGDGGGIHATGGRRHFDGGIEIRTNHSYGNGGALWASGDDGTRIPGDSTDAGSCTADSTCLVEGNEAEGHGGAFFLSDSELIAYADDGPVHGLQLIRNRSGDSGGAVHASNHSVIRVNSPGNAEIPGGASLWVQNTATQGGGAVLLSSSDMVLNDATFGGEDADVANHAVAGGAVYVTGTGTSGLGLELRLLNSRLSGNTAELHGGGIFATGGARLEIGSVKCASSVLPADRYCSEISGNDAPDGAAIFTLGATLELGQTAIIGNTGGLDGAALVINGQNDSSFIENVLFTGNESHAIRIDDQAAFGTSVQVDSSTLVDHPGAAIVLADEPGVDLLLYNTLLWNNGFASIDGLSGSASASQSCSLIAGGQLGALATDPLLIGNPRGSHRLDIGSPAIDACLAGPIRDLDGNNRDSMPDIGAFEFGGALPPAVFADGFESP